VRHVRTLGLCLVAVLAVAAVVLSSASAKTPEWGKCESVGAGNGKYSANCTTKAKGGGYEWVKGKSLKNIPFTGHNVGSGGVLWAYFEECHVDGKPVNEPKSRKQCVEEGGEVLEHSKIPVQVECEAESNTGETSGKDLLVNVQVTFTGCAVVGVFPCVQPGGASGEIKVNSLKGQLGYINQTEKKVGVLLEPVEKHGLFAQFECFVVYDEVGIAPKKQGPFYEPKGGNDGVISPIEPVNTMTSSFSQVYSVNEKEENVPSHFQAGKTYLLENLPSNRREEKPIYGLWTPAGEEITVENISSEPGEIKA
jgi:hypothetical protein